MLSHLDRPKFGDIGLWEAEVTPTKVRESQMLNSLVTRLHPARLELVSATECCFFYLVYMSSKLLVCIDQRAHCQCGVIPGGLRTR